MYRHQLLFSYTFPLKFILKMSNKDNIKVKIFLIKALKILITSLRREIFALINKNEGFIILFYKRLVKFSIQKGFFPFCLATLSAWKTEARSGKRIVGHVTLLPMSNEREAHFCTVKCTAINGRDRQRPPGRSWGRNCFRPLIWRTKRPRSSWSDEDFPHGTFYAESKEKWTLSGGLAFG